MAKTKTKRANIHRPLVMMGYILFVLLVIGVILSTIIPFGTILFHPNSMKINVAVVLLALTVGAILPVLIGYFIGDHSVKSKSKLNHHFNGVLFGLLAYWIVTVFSIFMPNLSQLFTDHNIRIVLTNLSLCVGVGIITTVLAAMHVRSTKSQHDLLEYKPFVVVLVALIVVMPIIGFFNNIATNSINVYSFVPIGVVMLIGLASYVSLLRVRLVVSGRVAWSAIAVSILFVALYVFSMLESSVSSYLTPYPTMESQALGSIVASVLAVVSWLVYWVLQVKVLRRATRWQGKTLTWSRNGTPKL